MSLALVSRPRQRGEEALQAELCLQGAAGSLLQHGLSVPAVDLRGWRALRGHHVRVVRPCLPDLPQLRPQLAVRAIPRPRGSGLQVAVGPGGEGAPPAGGELRAGERWKLRVPRAWPPPSGGGWPSSAGLLAIFLSGFGGDQNRRSPALASDAAWTLSGGCKRLGCVGLERPGGGHRNSWLGWLLVAEGRLCSAGRRSSSQGWPWTTRSLATASTATQPLWVSG